MEWKEALEGLIAGQSMERPEARALMDRLLDDPEHAEKKAGVLVALRAKGATAAELAGFCDALTDRMEPVELATADLVDTCGTGGGRASFNISTGAALLAAGAGAKIAKHGNRAVSSRSGSADVLQALGVSLEADPRRQMEASGFAFLFAPRHHSALKSVGPLRQALGVRTVFNQLGPLLNPAGAQRQMIGVYDSRLVQPMAGALSLLGRAESWAVHGQDGLDEVSPCGATLACRAGGMVERWETLRFGLEPLSLDLLPAGGSPEESARLIAAGLHDPESDAFRAMHPAAAAAVELGLQVDPLEASARVRDACASGAALACLQALRSLA